MVFLNPGHQSFKQLRRLRAFPLKDQAIVLAQKKMSFVVGRFTLRLFITKRRDPYGVIGAGQSGFDALPLQHHQIGQRPVVQYIADGFIRLQVQGVSAVIVNSGANPG